MIKFTQIPDKLPYPPKHRAKLSTLHSEIITYIINHFTNTNRYKTKVVSLLNTISCYILFGNTIPKEWSTSDPFKGMDMMDPSYCEDVLGNIYLHVRNIIWDIEETDNSSIQIANDNHPVVSVDKNKSEVIEDISHNIKPTPKEDLYIRPPSIPRLDISSPYLDKIINNTHYTIYRSLPEIPITQSQISVTTDIDRMTDMDLLRLYPNTFIRTRSATMYELHSDMELDEDIGVIFHICDYTTDQIKDNIIRYPHIFKLMRMVDNKIVSFYSNIEIDGVLYNTLEIWDTLPDSKYIPRNSEFIKEYVVRRYLLERDIDKIDHKYPIFGTLDPFLTLFTTNEDYIRMGYKDTLNIAKQCVISRVNYKQSRNPVLRMVNNE